MTGIYLLLGSNLGDRKGHLARACELIEQKVGVVTDRSNIYRTEAWGSTQQPSYYNQVVKINTDLVPSRLLDEILSIEEEIGRVRQSKWESRIIDIDILYYNQQILDESRLALPHPQIPNRRFTLVPLCELAPDLKHPQLGMTNIELLENCEDQLLVEPLRSKL
ncbi:MAG: 2-amino-4-hydroxy-6-hydroxymethyldihydropteridine diphosphokinase [Cyclobacteriaceae bacterium]